MRDIIDEIAEERGLGEFERIQLKLEAEGILKELRRERKDCLKSLRAEMREQYCRELWLETNPLPRLMKRHLRQNGYAKLINLCEDVAEQVAREQYSRPVGIGYDIEIKRLDRKLAPLIKWLKENPIPDRTYRNAKLFKNLAIYWVLKGLSDDQIRKEAREVLAKTRDKRTTEIMGWVSWTKRQIERGKEVKVNTSELQKWVDDARGVENG